MQNFRHWIYEALEEQKGGGWAKALNIFLMALISLNVIAVAFESEAAIHQYSPHAFLIFETVSVIIFTVEYILRAWSQVESPNPHFQEPVKGRLRYLLTPMALIDLLAILPLYLGFFFGLQDLLMLRCLRLLRVLKLTRYSQSMELLTCVLKQEAETMVSALFMLCILILLAATGIYLMEGEHQPETFGSIPRALWWATVTLTTVGYGDAVPLTITGKMFSGLITITGIAVAALPAAILASGLISELDRRRDTFRNEMRQMLEDGHFDFSELRYLEKRRREMGVGRATAHLILEELRQENRRLTHIHCPHCSHDLTIKHPPGIIQVQPEHDEG